MVLLAGVRRVQVVQIARVQALAAVLMMKRLFLLGKLVTQNMLKTDHLEILVSPHLSFFTSHFLFIIYVCFYPCHLD